MYELQNMKDFLQNPIGKGTSILPNKEIILNDFKRRYEQMISKGKKFNVDVYHNEFYDAYYFHVKVPSETNRNNDYDVVLQLTPPKNQTGLLKPPTIDKYEVRFFSNSPSFVYTYAHIMYQNDMMVKFLSKKYDKIVLRKEPVVKNPTGVVLYEKSITFAILSILSNTNYFSRTYLKTIQKNFAENVLMLKIRTDEKILEEIDKEKQRLGQIKKEEERARKADVAKRSKEAKQQTTAKSGTTNKRIVPKTSTSKTSSTKSTNRVTAKKSTRKG